MRSSVRMTRVAGRLRSTSIASVSRLKSAMTLKVRKRRPSHKASDMKSIDQLASPQLTLPTMYSAAEMCMQYSCDEANHSLQSLLD